MANTGKRKQSSARKWKRSEAEDVDLPSGNVALVKRPGMEVFLTEGLIPDRLMPIITKAVNTGKGLPQEKVAEMSADPKQMASMLDAMDRVVVRIVVEPKVLWHKEYQEGVEDPVVIPEEERPERLEKMGLDEDTIWTDEVFFEDKSFLFNYAVGGTRDLERFRSETEPSVAPVPPVEDVPVSA